MATGVEIANAYVAVTAKMPGIKKDIVTSLAGAEGQVRVAGRNIGSVLAGAIGGATAAATTKVINSVVGSLDKAIGRVDTMTNFPKIMKNLGYSAGDADQSIKKISDRLMGLPTSLDSLAGVVQQLAPMTASLGEATDLSLALNNALLAGGKSTDLQANAMEQYAQMLSVGKVDMAAWRSMVTAMPGQMDQLAKSLLDPTAKSMDLYEAMKEGRVSFGQFNDAIVQLNEKGLGQYASFADQAKDATGGIATAQQNLGTAITRGLANLIQKYQPQITAAFAAVTAFVNEAFKAISALFDWVGANMGWIGPLVLGLGAIAAGVIAVNAAMKLAAFATATWSNVTKIATGVQKAFNLVMNANPILRIITLVFALGAALVTFFKDTELGRQIFANIMNAIGAAFTWLRDVIVLPFVNAITTAWDGMTAGVGAAWQWLHDTIIMPVGTAISGVVTGIGNAVTWLNDTVVQPMVTAIGSAFTWLHDTIFKPIGDAINGVVTGIGNTVTATFKGMASFISKAFATAMDVIKAPINGVIGIINGAIDALNKISITIPDWVPMIGGQKWGINIPKIPQLAEGGLITARPGGMLAQLGEGRYDEVVVPLSPKVLGQLGGGKGNSYEYNVYAAEGMDADAVGKAIARETAFQTQGEW